MEKTQRKTIHDFVSIGFSAIVSAYGKGEFDALINERVVPGMADILRSDSGSASRLNDLAGRFDQMIREYPEEFGHLVVMAMSMGVGFSVSEEVR